MHWLIFVNGNARSLYMDLEIPRTLCKYFGDGPLWCRQRAICKELHHEFTHDPWQFVRRLFP